MNNLKLGLAGAGRMGTPMAKRLLAAGYSVRVYDTNATAVEALAAQGAGKAATPAELAKSCDVVLLSLPTPEIVQAVCLDLDGLASVKGARIVIDLSTTGPRTERLVAKGLKAAGIALADCPVSGGVGGAEKGTLAMMAKDAQPPARVVDSLPGEVIAALLVLDDHTLAVATRKDRGAAGRTFLFDTQSLVSTALDFGGPVRALFTHPGATAGTRVYGARHRIFGVLDEEACGSPACGGRLMCPAWPAPAPPDRTGCPRWQRPRRSGLHR